MTLEEKKERWRAWFRALPDHTLVLPAAIYDEIERSGALGAYQAHNKLVVRNLPVLE